jgi:ribonuclease HI
VLCVFVGLKQGVKLAKKYYVVWKGRETGIFTNWAQCKAQVDGFSGAKYKAFPSLEGAESAFGRETNSKSVKPKITKRISKPKAVPLSNRETNSMSVKPKTTKKTSKSKAIPLSQKDIIDMPFDIKIFTDGACVPNPGEAGTGLAVYQNNDLTELWYGLYQSSGTNNTAELHGLNQGLLLAKEKSTIGLSVAIFCDSKYSINCITKWATSWKKKGWTKSGGEIKNLDIIKPAYALYQEFSSEIAIHHVNGHVGIEGNELADRMSVLAIESQDNSLNLYRETSDISKILALGRG